MEAAVTATIRIRADQLAEAREKAGLSTDTAFAAAVGIHRSNIARTLSGKAAPSGEFVAGVLAALPDRGFDDLFTIEDWS